MLKLTGHVKAGDGLMDRLQRARTRDDIAKYVRALRRWHGDLQPIAEAHSAPLAESLRKQNSHEEEYQRVAGVYDSLAQARLLMTTATALYRLAPHLAAVPRGKPGRKPGQGAYKDEKALAEMTRLENEEGMGPSPASRKAVDLADRQGTQDIHQRTKRIYDKYCKLRRINSKN